MELDAEGALPCLSIGCLPLDACSCSSWRAPSRPGRCAGLAGLAFVVAAGASSHPIPTCIPAPHAEAAEQLLNAQVVLREYVEALRKRDPARAVATAEAAAQRGAAEAWHHLTHLVNKQASTL